MNKTFRPKMPISFTEVEDSPLRKMAERYDIKQYIRVKADAILQKELPFPSDYEFSECFLPKMYLPLADRIENFRINSNDILVASFPKTGTTWTLNIVSYLMNNLDFSANYKTELDLFFERAMFYEINDENKNDESYKARGQKFNQILDNFEAQPSPRLFRTHLPAFLLPKAVWHAKSKVICLCRDAKDVAISKYHMDRNLSFINFEGDLNDYLNLFLNDHLIYTPFYDHVYSYWQLQHFDNILMIKYEDMIADPLAGVQKISKFLNYNYDMKQLEEFVDHVSFGKMREKASHRDYNSKGYK